MPAQVLERAQAWRARGTAGRQGPAPSGPVGSVHIHLHDLLPLHSEGGCAGAVGRQGHKWPHGLLRLSRTNNSEALEAIIAIG